MIKNICILFFILSCLCGCSTQSPVVEPNFQITTTDNNQIAPTPSTEPLEEVLPEASTKPVFYPDIDDLDFADLSGFVFWFGSGAGAWRTTLEIMPDGTFNGHYLDSNAGESGHNYMGTTYECYFSGKFTTLRKIGEYEYAMKCESLTQEGTIEEEIIYAGHKIITSTPYGFDNADEFILYLPGKEKNELPEEFLPWSHGLFKDDFLDTYGLYNIVGEMGFIVWPEWELLQPQTTSIAWKGITYGQSFFDLYINVNGTDYYAGNFFGENLWQYERTDAPKDALTFFRGIWTGAGSEFYIKRKSETEIAVMYHDIQYNADPSDFPWDDYEEILAIPIDNEKEIEIGEEPIIFRLSHHFEPVG